MNLFCSIINYDMGKKFKINDYVIFINPNRSLNEEETPFDFGYIVNCIEENTYNVRVSDRKSKYWQCVYMINSESIELANCDDKKTYFKIE